MAGRMRCILAWWLCQSRTSCFSTATRRRLGTKCALVSSGRGRRVGASRKCFAPPDAPVRRAACGYGHPFQAYSLESVADGLASRFPEATVLCVRASSRSGPFARFLNFVKAGDTGEVADCALQQQAPTACRAGAPSSSRCAQTTPP